jgi:hypothetical protein
MKTSIPVRIVSVMKPSLGEILRQSSMDANQVIVSGAVAALEPAFLWLGGGAKNVKLRVSVSELVASLGAAVAPDLTTPRDDIA